MNAAPSYQPLTSARRDDYLRFFDTRAFTDNPRWASCYCYFPLHDPAAKPWRERSGAENRTAAADCIAGGSKGVLAYDGTEVIGWCNAGPWSQFPMLREIAPPDAATLGAIWCFIVAPEWRGRGVARGLLDAACALLRELGLTAVVARPQRSADTAAALHTGPLAMYLAAGFIETGSDADGHVMVRRALP